MKDFRGKVAVVTGAASGIGQAMAARFAAEGMRVVLADIEAGALMETEEALRRDGADAVAVQTDVSSAESVEALARKTLEAFGAVHVVCNNAGVSSPEGPIWEKTVADWQWVLGVNLWGVIHGVRVFVPLMLKQGTEGHIINTASRDAFIAGPLMGVYRSSKHAVVCISETLYFDLAMMRSRVKVSVLCPSLVQTRIRQSERNRPAELTNADGSHSRLANHGADAKSRGIAPGEVAGRVIEAIRDEQLYVLTNPEEKILIQARLDWIMAGQNPTFLESREERMRRMREWREWESRECGRQN